MSESSKDIKIKFGQVQVPKKTSKVGTKLISNKEQAFRCQTIVSPLISNGISVSHESSSKMYRDIFGTR